MVKGDSDSVYVRLYNKFQELLARDSDSGKTNTYGITYIETAPLLKFEKDHNTMVTISHKDSNKRFAIFKLGKVNQVASINKKVTPDDELHKEKLAISNCRNHGGEQFWLIHLVDKVTVYKPAPFDIDELNNDLDSLLSI